MNMNINMCICICMCRYRYRCRYKHTCADTLACTYTYSYTHVDAYVTERFVRASSPDAPFEPKRRNCARSLLTDLILTRQMSRKLSKPGIKYILFGLNGNMMVTCSVAVLKNEGPLFGSPCNKDHNELGPRYVWKPSFGNPGPDYGVLVYTRN